MVENKLLRFLLYLRFGLYRILAEPCFQFGLLKIKHLPLRLVMGIQENSTKKDEAEFDLSCVPKDLIMEVANYLLDAQYKKMANGQ